MRGLQSPFTTVAIVAFWRPDTPGFYEIAAVDDEGRTSVSKIEVLSLDQLSLSYEN